MDFVPDIVVSGEDWPPIRVVVETKLVLDDRKLKAAESALKRYMLGMRIPVGLLVSPTRLAIYRDRYTALSEDSIELIGTFDAPRTWLPSGGAGDTSPGRGFAFERDVQAWLEEIASTHLVRDLSPEAREAFTEHVLPILAGGTVRAAGPRELKAG